MKQLLFLLIILAGSGYQCFSQDTLHFRDGRVVVGETVEVEEDSVSFIIKTIANNTTPGKINVNDIKFIRFFNGYIERFAPSLDSVRMVDGSSVYCTIAEVEEDAVLVRTVNGGEKIVRIPADSISSISYGNGYFEFYRKQRIIPADGEVLVKDKGNKPGRKRMPAAIVGEKESSTDGSEAKRTKANKKIDNKSQDQDNKVIVKKEKGNKKKNTKEKGQDKLIDQPLIVEASRKNEYIAVCSVLDSATGLSRSAALCELLRNNLFVTSSSDTLWPLLYDYPYESAYAITGIFLYNTAKFKVYKKGKKINEFSSSQSWQDIYTRLAGCLQNESYAGRKKIKPVAEGGQYKFKETRIDNMLPGTIATNVPHSAVVDTFQHVANMNFYKNEYPLLTAKEIYGQYTQYNESKLFFFRNSDIPENLRHEVRKLVFPISKTLAPSLTYLSCGEKMYRKKDPYSALNLLMGGLVSSNSLLSSPYERCLLKSKLYTQISEVYTTSFSGKIYMTELFKLGSDLNYSVLNSGDIKKQRLEYYDAIAEIRSLCVKAEDKAREIRGTKRLGGFMALMNAAGSVATASATDNVTSQAMMDQATLAFDESFTQAFEASEALSAAFSNLDGKIDAGSFTVSDGTEVDLGKSFLAGEIVYHLNFKPLAVRNVLMRFSDHKPKLKSLLNGYYDTGDDKKKREILKQIFRHVSEMEARIVAAESRNRTLTSNIISEF